MSEQRQVLIVDDDRKIALAVAMRLRGHGYGVEVAHDGEAGLAAANALLPHAIVLDIRMPKMDGLTVLSKLQAQAQTRHIPVIMLSASAVDERRALDLGAYCFLPKPYDAQILLLSVEKALGSAVTAGH